MNKTTYWIVLAAAILMDVITGLIKAVYTHTFQSRIMREGLFHKVGELMAGGVLYGAQIVLPMIGVETNLPLFPAGVGYCFIMELGSILENLRAFTPALDYILGRGGFHVRDDKGLE